MREKLVEKVRNKVIVLLLMAIGLLIAVNAIHAYEEAEEFCLACMDCLKCEACGKCIDGTTCENCLECEECLACEGCDEELIYEDWQLPKIEVEEPDGANGYYRRVPEIRVNHYLDKLWVHYRFVNEQGESSEGIVSGTDGILEVVFDQGENVLEVWVELPDRIWNEKRVFQLDSVKPEAPRLTHQQLSANGNLYSGDSVSISFESADEGSGVYGYFCRIGNQEESFMVGEVREITIEDEFTGTIEVTAIDFAGNKSEVAVSPLIIIDKSQPIISVLSNKDLGSWSHSGVDLEVKIEEWGVSSGLESVRVYLDNEMVLIHTFSQGEKKVSLRETLSIDKSSLHGLGSNLRVEARDHVGNEAVMVQHLLIDTENPTVEVIGTFDYMIIGSDRAIEIELEDENLLSYYQVNILHTSFEEEESEMVLQGEIRSTTKKISVNLEDEGWFVIEALARDISGRETTAILNVILDKTNPIIQYVEQLDGKHIPYFQWNYQPEEMIYDALDVQYGILLNGSRYEQGTLVEREGGYVFQVNAEDEAGNRSSAVASFIIDNTPPEIHFYNVVHGESYEAEIMAGIAVTGVGERIKRIEINGERANIESNSQMVQFRFSQVDDYTLVVEADDLAGNISIEKISFSIAEKPIEIEENDRTSSENALNQFANRVGGILPERVASTLTSVARENSSIMKVIAGIGLFIAAGGAGLMIYKKIKKFP